MESKHKSLWTSETPIHSVNTKAHDTNLIIIALCSICVACLLIFTALQHKQAGPRGNSHGPKSN